MIPADVLAQIKPGAKVKVFEEKTPFEGLIIARKHGSEAAATFTVRTVLADIAVEKIYPINSPIISKVQIISSPKRPHRSKLYFVRKVSKKKMRQRIGVSV